MHEFAAPDGPRVARILRAARAAHASDIHLIAGIPPAFRVDGEIVMADHDALTREDTRSLTFELLSDEQRAVFEREREICVSVFGTEAGRVRVTAYLHAGNAEAAIRLCQEEIPSGDELGLPEVVDDLTRRSSGLILVTGPTGVGKTTTLHYMIDQINAHQRYKIVMIEDPVEYIHRPKRSILVQQELHTDTSSYARALIHVLRQDPDLIVIGEMRETETIETALTAAETGHLVLSTLHTPGVEQTVERIVGVFPAARQNQVLLQLASTLQAILGQLLLPRADRRGRILATEVLLATIGVRNIVREGNIHLLPSAMQTGVRDGMRTMDMALQDLYQRGLITWDTALNHSRNPDLFQKSKRRREE